MDNSVIFESTDTFSVPARVVDYYLKAPDVELRLILFLMRHVNSSFTRTDICNAIGADEERTDKAFKYWCAAGILFKSGNKYIAERPKLMASDIANYTADQIATRISEDAQLRFLYSRAEEALAKPLSTSDASTIFSLVDWNGLPAEVAAMLIQFCASKGKGLSRIQKLGIEWAEHDINTYEKAEEYIRNEQLKSDTVSRIASMLGLTHRALTDKEKAAFVTWSTEYGYSMDIIKMAYEHTVANTGTYKYPYMDSILRSWYDSGYRTAEEIAANDDGSKKKPAKRAPKKRYESSIDKKDIKNSMDDSWAIIKAELGEDK